jgi:DNA mismatch repair ATPase MutS
MSLSSTSVIFGANGSGKSIHLKTLGNIVYLAQIGSLVPCQYAQIPIFHKVLTKFTTFEDP